MPLSTLFRSCSLAAEQGALRGADDRAGGALSIAIDRTAEQRAGGAADDQPGRSARPAAIAMTRPIIATIPIMAAAIIAAIVAPVVPAVIVEVLIMGVTVMEIARLRLTRHGGHGAHT